MIENRLSVRVLGAQAAVIEVERSVGVDQPHHVGARFAEAAVKLRLGLVQTLSKSDRFATPGDDLIDFAAQ